MMQAAPLLGAKLLPPAPGPFHLPRRRLLERLSSGLDGRATVVLAGPGYGKTALVARFLQELDEETVWYSLDATDGDPGLFFRYLIQGIREHAAEFGERSEGTWSPQGPTETDAERLADIFVNEAEEGLGGRLVLVLDGVHHLESSAACLKALRRVLAWAPGTLHIFLLGRSLPDLGIRALEAEGAVNIVRDDELRFTLDETRALLRESFGLQVTDGMSARLHERTRGWVTALQLLRQTARLGSGARSIPEDLFEKTESEIFDYFSEEVLASEMPPVREFLLASSLPDFIDPDICVEALPGADVQGILGGLVKRHVFLSPLESRAEYYAYDPLFRDFLRRRLLTDQGAKAKRQLDARYARSFARRGALPEAIAHAISAEDVPQVVDLLRRHGHAMLRAGTLSAVVEAARFATAQGAGGAFTDDLLGEAARISGDYSRAVTHFEHALEARTDGEPDLVGTARATTLQGLAYSLMKRGESGRAAEFAEQALREAGDADHDLIARILNTAAILRYRENRLTEALSGWQTALDHARSSGDRHLVLMLAHNLGLPHAVMGDFQRASECFQILTGPENLHVGPQEGAAYLNLARIATIRGEFARAASYLGDATEIARKLRLPSLAADALEAEGNLLRESGEYDVAAEKYARARRIFTELGQMDVVQNIDEESAILAARRGSFEEAERIGSSVLAHWRAAGDSEAAASILLALGEIRVRASRPQEAVEVLAESADLYHTFGRSYQEFLARAWLALARFRAADTEGARTDASTALELASRFDYRAPLMRIALIDGRFLDMLGGLPHAPAYLAQAEARAAAAKAEPPAPVSGSAADLTVRLFGPIEIFRDEERKIPASAWKIRRALEMFCYLASSRNHRASKDRLVDALWGNARPSTVDKNFHPTISFLRRALNHGHPISKNFLLYEHGAYLLNPSYRYEIDADAFESNIRSARSRAARGDADGACREYGAAFALYRGPFMEEEYAEWTEALRSHYGALRRRAMAELADLRYRSGETDAAIELFEDLVRIDPVDEKASSGLMRAMAVRGDQAGIEKEWQRFGREFRRELGAAPSAEARRTYESALAAAKSRAAPMRQPSRRQERAKLMARSPGPDDPEAWP